MAFLADKIYALDRDKAEFCYHICRAIDARRVVEIGTSYGVSPSIWLLRCATMSRPAAAAG
jgi:predicted O-methyltransferase YrrM